MPRRRPADDAPIIVAAPILERTPAGGWRLSARVDADEVFIEADEPLSAGVDAFAAAFLLPAAKRGVALRLDGDLDRTLAANLDRIQPIARRYWGFPGGRVEPRGLVAREPAGGGAMFFTGGVDSFHTLRRHRESIERLIFVDGIDLGLDDRARFAPVRAGIEAVARELGLGAVFPRTNVRRNPTFSSLGWGTTFIGGLAAVAHAMTPVVSTIHVAGSGVDFAWGSTRELDPLWSSGALTVIHDDAGGRLEKVRAIADWEPVHGFLRVCYARREGVLNCGACEKCVRTQAGFAAVGALDRLTTFPRAPLVELIDAVPHVPALTRDMWQDIRLAIGDERAVAAIDRLLGRRPGVGERLRHALRPWLERVPGGGALRRAGVRLLKR